MWLLICGLLIGADQLIKWWTVSKLSLVGTIPLIDGVFHLTYVENKGAAFGMFQNSTVLLAVITAAEVAFIVYFFLKKTNSRMWILRLAMVFVISGAVGNFIDRVLRGFVVDMFDFRLINFYVFNFADVCICAGVALIAYHIFFLHDKLAGKEQS